MAGRVLQTDYKRIGRSGQTTDGRVIDPKWLVEAAETYDPELFKALIWPEHMRYENYGTVEALRVTDNEEGGKDLWAVLAPNAFYLSDNRFGQKLFTSMELTFDFRKTGKAYLTGLGATDDPSSVGTTEVRFSKSADKLKAAVSPFVEAQTKTFTDQQPDTLLDQIKALFKTQPHEDAEMADKKALEELKAEIGEIKALFSKLTVDNKDDEAGAEGDDTTDPTVAAFEKLTARMDALEAKFSKSDTAAVDKDTAGNQIAELTKKFNAMSDKLDSALKEQPGTEGGEQFGATEKADTYL